MQRRAPRAGEGPTTFTACLLLSLAAVGATPAAAGADEGEAGSAAAAGAPVAGAQADRPVVAHLTNGSRIVGTLQSMDSTQAVLVTDAGTLTIPRDEIVWIDFGRAEGPAAARTAPLPIIGGTRDRAWLGVTGRLAHYRMTDLNAEIRDAGYGEDALSQGLNVGAEVGWWMTPALAIAAHYERLLAEFDPSNSLHYDLPANAWFLGVRMRSDPRRWPIIEAELGAGGVFLNGTMTAPTSSLPSGQVEGTGGFFQFVAGLDFGQDGLPIRVNPNVGYRLARVPNPTADGEEIVEIDYSGWMVGLTVKYVLD